MNKNVIKLSDTDFKIVENIINNSPEPNEKLKKAFEKFNSSKITIPGLIKKYKLLGKTEEEIQKIVGDSDVGCMTIPEYNFLNGDDFIIKSRNLYNYINKNFK